MRETVYVRQAGRRGQQGRSETRERARVSLRARTRGPGVGFRAEGRAGPGRAPRGGPSPQTLGGGGDGSPTAGPGEPGDASHEGRDGRARSARPGNLLSASHAREWSPGAPGPAAPTSGREALREHLHGGDARHLHLAVIVPVPVQKQEPATDRGVRATALRGSGRPVPGGSARPHLWLLERRQTIVSGFSELPKVTRKVAPAEGTRREHAAAPAPPSPGQGHAQRTERSEAAAGRV